MTAELIFEKAYPLLPCLTPPLQLQYAVALAPAVALGGSVLQCRGMLW